MGRYLIVFPIVAIACVATTREDASATMGEAGVEASTTTTGAVETTDAGDDCGELFVDACIDSGTGCGILYWSPASGLLNEGNAPGLPPLV